MEQYAKYLRKSRFDRDYAEASIEETLQRHEAILDKLALERGYYVSKTYYEVVSGESISARPEVQKLLEEVNAGIYAGVLVVDLERLARGNGADQAYISQIFQFSGTKIITPTKVYDPSNEFDEEYFEFGLFMSRREYKTINRRLIRGRESSATEGKYLGSIAPYGYQRAKLKNEKGYTLEPLPEEADAVRRIFSMALQNKGTKLIANTLNDLHVPTRHGDLWTYTTISNILRNPVYMGKIRRGYCKQIKSVEQGIVKKRIVHQKNLEDYRLFEGRHPAIISEEVFYQTQQMLNHREPAARVKKDVELQNAFAGLIFCARCGKRIGRTITSKKKGQMPRLRCVNQRNCHNRSADYETVEQQIISSLQGWLQGYQVKVEAIGFTEDIEDQKRKIAQLAQEQSKVQQQLDNAFDLLEQGVYTLEIFRQRQGKLSAALEELAAQKQAAEAQLQQLENHEREQTTLIPHTESLLESYDAMTIEERNALLKTILYRITYERGADGEIIIDLYPRLPKL